MDINDYLKKLKNIAVVNNLVQNFEYNGSTMHVFMFTYLFIKNYDVDTSLSLVFFSEELNKIKIREIGEELNSSLSDISWFTLHITRPGDRSGHATLIIYRKNKNRLEFYDPNGETIGYGDYIKNTVYRLVSVLRYVLPNFEFVPSWKLHRCLDGNRCNGLQTLVNNGPEDLGICQLWCYLIIELVLKYPYVLTEDIIDSINYDKTLRKSKLARHMKEVIRGYYYSSMKKISKLFSKGGSDIFIYPGMSFNDEKTRDRISDFIKLDINNS